MGQTSSVNKGNKRALSIMPAEEAPDAVVRRVYLDRLGIRDGGRSSPMAKRGRVPGNFELAREEEEASDGPDAAPADGILDGSDTSSAGPSDEVISSSGTPRAARSDDAVASSKILLRRTDFRVSYLKTLAYSKVWVPLVERPPKHQTVIIFDWDDTLLCTSWLARWGDRYVARDTQEHLQRIAVAARRLLEAAQQMGQTLVITNAVSGWVEYSAAKWMPELLPILQGVRVISARSRFEPAYPGDVSRWKEQAFMAVQRQLDSEIIANLVSVGDSHWEMDAAQAMGNCFEQALVKTIKLRQRPTPEELCKELELVGQKFDKIVVNARDMKVSLEKK